MALGEWALAKQLAPGLCRLESRPASGEPGNRGGSDSNATLESR